MPKIIKHSFTLLLLVVMIIAGSAVVINQTHEAQAQTANTLCPAGSSLFIDNVTTGGTSLAPGLHQLSVSVSSVLASTVQGVQFSLDSEATPIGRGVRLGSNPYWSMQWYTQVSPPGSHVVSATVTLSNGKCTIPNQIPVAIYNTGTLPNTLGLQTVPLQFEGFTNEPRDFTLTSNIFSGTAVGPDITQWAVFKKAPVSLGVVSPQDSTSSFRFSAGTVPGQSSISVIAFYGGVSKAIGIPVKVLAQATTPTPTGTSVKPAGSTSTTATSGTGLTTTNTTTTGSGAVPASSPISVESDPAVKSCVVSSLTDQRYLAINSGKTRVSADEFESLRQCFAIRNYVLPSSLVPVATNKVKETPVSPAVKVEAMDNHVEKSKNSTKQTLRFRGQAKPNTTVLLYVFSEPLVLSTSTDANGDWSYSLEDPMQPGKHEVYALVNKGDGNYERSSVFSFAIAKAEAASSNPNGYSLQLERNQPTAPANNYMTKVYVGVVALLVLVVLAVFARVYIRSHKSEDLVSEFDSIAASQPTNDATAAAQPENSATASDASTVPTPALDTAVPTVPQSSVVEVATEKEKYNTPDQTS
jgi:hypothetical protein